MSEKANTAGTSPGKATTGFVLCERVVSEFHTLKRSPSLAKWESQLKDGLAKFQAENPNPKAAKEAQAIQSAFALAQELAELLKKDAATRPQKS